MTTGPSAPTTEGQAEHPADLVLQNADAIVAHIEINDHHGVGVLVRRLFGESKNILSIRSNDFYEGRQEFGNRHICISHGGSSRDLAFWRVLEALAGTTVGRVLCVPYFPDDALTAIALKELFTAPLCTFIMDDQNLCSDGIPDATMNELLAKSSLRLAISSELCEGYQRKYGYKLGYMPPLVSTRHILSHLNPLPDTALSVKEGIILGNIWGARWLELLQDTVRGSGITLTWHCGGAFRWVTCDKETLIHDGIVPHDGPALEDGPLIELLRQAPFVVVPSGILDATDDRAFIAKLSFPSRIPYILATSQSPMLVLGNPETAAARFVTKAGIGVVAPYETGAFQRAVEYITDPAVNLRMRRAALLLAGRFADLGAAEWIWASLAKGEPADLRYEDLRTPSEAQAPRIP
jgi:hypothetical protein